MEAVQEMNSEKMDENEGKNCLEISLLNDPKFSANGSTGKKGKGRTKKSEDPSSNSASDAQNENSASEDGTRSSGRARVVPKRYQDTVESFIGSASKRKRIKNSKTPSTGSDDSNSKMSTPIDARDPLEEDLTMVSMCFEKPFEVNEPEPKSATQSACPSPASGSSSLGSNDSPSRPLNNSKRLRAKGRNQSIDSKVQSPLASLPTPNGISPRKMHKKFGKYSAISDMANGIDSPDKASSETPSTPDHSALLTSPTPSMKVKSRWRLSVEQNDLDKSCETSAPNISTVEKTPTVDIAKVVEEINSSEETKAEIQKRLSSFDHITESTFLCERRFNKESRGMDCDCTLSKEDVFNGRKGCGDDCLNRLLFIECGKSCSLGKRCSNKRFQNVENSPTEIFKTYDKGFGIRATQDTPRDTFIMEYVGEVLDPHQFRKRARRYAKDDAQHFYFMALSSEYFIDASSKGSISRFINHSCDPNAETQKWTVNGELRVGFFSKRLIRKGEEITFDYKYERYGQEAQKCYCGAKSCRGWLGGEPDKENRKPEIESDDDYWSSSDDDDITFSKPQPSQQQQQHTQHESSPSVIKQNNQMAAKLKKIRQQRPLRSPRKMKKFEDQEYGEEIDYLKSTGIRTKTHTVELCRLMVRVTDLHTKLTLASMLREADNPCRRLFLDYHGLKILNGWMTSLGNSLQEVDLKIAIEDTLSALAIPHKTMLVDSKVWQTITKWSESKPVESKESSRATTPDNKITSKTGTPIKSVPESPKLAVNQMFETKPDENVQKEVSSKMDLSIVKCDSTEDNSKDSEDIQMDVDIKEEESKPSPDSSVELFAAKIDIDSFNKVDENETNSDHSKSPEIKTETDEIIPTPESSKSKSILDKVSSQKVETQDFGFEKVDENLAVEIPPVSKPELASPEKSVQDKNEIEMEEKTRTVRAKAVALLSLWSSLQEVFKIPKRELVKLRAEHEREVDRAAAKANSNNSMSRSFGHSAYERHKHRPTRQDSPTRRENRISRLDDMYGLLKQENLSREHRRHFFEMRATLQQEELYKRTQLKQQHEHKCYFLKLDPSITPMFEEHPEFYFDPASSQWHRMPERTPYVEVTWGYPKMANLPYEAFKPTDGPLPDPSYAYPPGVVPLSYFHGVPMSLDPSLLPVAPPLPPMPPPVDLTEIPLPSRDIPTHYIDPATGEEIPIPEELPTYEMFPNDRFLRPDAAPSLHSFNTEIPLTNGFGPESWNHLEQPQQHYLNEQDCPPAALVNFDHQVVAAQVPSYQAVTSSANNSAIKKIPGQKAEVFVRLPKYWKMAKDPEGRPYYYHSKTKETRWEPPNSNDVSNKTIIMESTDIVVVEMETLSTDSECPAEEMEEDGEESDNEDDESDKEEDIEKNAIIQNSQERTNNSTSSVTSDLSAHEKEYLLRLSRKKTKEERRLDRRNKKERDPEKWEEERMRRRERHVKHRKDGLVVEYIIPRRTDRDKMGLMSLKEQKERQANQKAIREMQNLEELAELEKEKEEERERRSELERRLKNDRDQAAVAMALAMTAEAETYSKTTTAAADTSSEVIRKIKDRFLKEASKIIVKLLDPYRRPDATVGKIQTVEDFKHLAKKLTNYLLQKELKYCKRIEDLKCTDSVKKKSSDFVRKYMSKFGEFYKKSPGSM